MTSGNAPDCPSATAASITVAALVALNRTEQLPGHLRRAIDNGVTHDELVEVITHLAFYSGWPTAMSAVTIAKKLFEPS